jgi:transposase-like protein
MAYRKNTMNSKIESDPKGAANDLVALYIQCDASQKQLAERLGCAEQTVGRWIKKLEEAGTGVVRRMDRAREQAARKGLPTRPPQGWRRKAVATA